MKTAFKFVEKKNLWLVISTAVILLGFSLMGFRALSSQPTLNYGIDFVGGNTFLLKLIDKEVQLNDSKLISDTRSALASYGLAKSQIQLSENNQLYIKTTSIDKNITSAILNDLKASLGNFEILEIDYIGPSIGATLKKQSLWIILFVSLSLLLYISIRFELSFGLAALAAVLHDALVIISVSSILSLEINTAFIAAILTILGYSINDTIVIFDRIREQLEKLKNKKSLIDITNISLNQTLLRTINTSITTLLVIGSLILFSDGTIKEFCLILLVGIISGTYSSLCIASPLFTLLYKESDTEHI